MALLEAAGTSVKDAGPQPPARSGPGALEGGPRLVAMEGRHFSLWTSSAVSYQHCGSEQTNAGISPRTESWTSRLPSISQDLVFQNRGHHSAKALPCTLYSLFNVFL